jgi:hypothetical protein
LPETSTFIASLNIIARNIKLYCQNLKHDRQKHGNSMPKTLKSIASNIKTHFHTHYKSLLDTSTLIAIHIKVHCQKHQISLTETLNVIAKNISRYNKHLHNPWNSSLSNQEANVLLVTIYPGGVIILDGWSRNCLFLLHTFKQKRTLQAYR